MKCSVFVVVDAHVRVEIGGRVDKERGDSGVFGDKVVEDDVGISGVVVGVAAVVASEGVVSVQRMGTIGGQGAGSAGGAANVAGGRAHAALGNIVWGSADDFGFGLDAGRASGTAESAWVGRDDFFGAVRGGDGVLGSRRWRVGSGRDVRGDRLKQALDVVAFCEFDGNVKWNPCSLVLSVAALYFFVNALLDLSLEDTRTLGLVETDDFEDLSGIEPVVGSSPHDGHIVDDAFVHGYARVGSLVKWRANRQRQSA